MSYQHSLPVLQHMHINAYRDTQSGEFNLLALQVKVADMLREQAEENEKEDECPLAITYVG